ncbi:hypothetical protein PC111_g17264 [Phytophthora cactorum]|nr:hypothetical protein PC111_g17264 [Phytophthora cactorum]
MLHSLHQLDGSDVLVMQDQMDITSGIVMQTKVQKLMFERWGETLVMDFTHGSLVVTTATSRDFPVVDFICLKEQTETISTILDYFKKTNPPWRDVETVVIDKDLSNGEFSRSALQKQRFCSASFTRYLTGKSPTLTVYESGYKALKQYCKTNKKQSLFAYFDKNWNACNEMWSNFARGKYFTAGNTTTNRIEFNWNQLKMLLGLKTRSDETIAGLLQHQITITQQIISEIGHLHSTSRMPKTVPKSLRAVATRISANILEKVKRE